MVVMERPLRFPDLLFITLAAVVVALETLLRSLGWVD
jgi:hypothetical protein